MINAYWKSLDGVTNTEKTQANQQKWIGKQPQQWLYHWYVHNNIYKSLKTIGLTLIFFQKQEFA